MLCCTFFQGENFLSERLLEEVVAEGKIYIIPAISGNLYFLRLAICAERTTVDDVHFSFNVIKTCTDRVMHTHFIREDKQHKPTIDIDISPFRRHSTSSIDNEVDFRFKDLVITNGINGDAEK